jgi:hypothetical protein
MWRLRLWDGFDCRLHSKHCFSLACEAFSRCVTVLSWLREHLITVGYPSQLEGWGPDLAASSYQLAVALDSACQIMWTCLNVAMSPMSVPHMFVHATMINADWRLLPTLQSSNSAHT